MPPPRYFTLALALENLDVALILRRQIMLSKEDTKLWQEFRKGEPDNAVARFVLEFGKE